MPGAARQTDMHVCPMSEPGPVPHVGMMISQGSGNVLINSLGAAREGDSALCVGPADSISKGSSSVNINGKPAARMGDPTDHGGAITAGSLNVIIGG
jgi:uncharacterized Zn-binding protein involved in type VI secretion